MGGVPTRKQREGDEGQREEHRYENYDHRRVVLVNLRIYRFSNAFLYMRKVTTFLAQIFFIFRRL
jgi:hypothetical protein